MEFTPTDEALDALEEADPAERDKFFQTLSPDEVEHLHAAKLDYDHRRAATPQPGPAPDPYTGPDTGGDPFGFSDTVDRVGKTGDYAQREILGKPMWEDGVFAGKLPVGMSPRAYDDVGLQPSQPHPYVTGGAAAGELMSRNPGARLLASRAYQGSLVTQMGARGERIMEESPDAAAGAAQLEQLPGGAGTAATLQFGAQMASQLPQMVAGPWAAGRTASEALVQNAPTLFQKAMSVGVGAGTSVLQNAVFASLGAERGQRLMAFLQSGDPAELPFWVAVAIGGIHPLGKAAEASLEPRLQALVAKVRGAPSAAWGAIREHIFGGPTLPGPPPLPGAEPAFVSGSDMQHFDIAPLDSAAPPAASALDTGPGEHSFEATVHQKDGRVGQVAVRGSSPEAAHAQAAQAHPDAQHIEIRGPVADLISQAPIEAPTFTPKDYGPEIPARERPPPQPAEIQSVDPKSFIRALHQSQWTDTRDRPSGNTYHVTPVGDGYRLTVRDIDGGLHDLGAFPTAKEAWVRARGDNGYADQYRGQEVKTFTFRWLSKDGKGRGKGSPWAHVMKEEFPSLQDAQAWAKYSYREDSQPATITEDIPLPPGSQVVGGFTAERLRNSQQVASPNPGQSTRDFLRNSTPAQIEQRARELTTPPRPPKTPPPAPDIHPVVTSTTPLGERVYVGPAVVDERGHSMTPSGRYMGWDPSKPGNAYVAMDDGRVKSVPLVNTHVIPEVGKKLLPRAPDMALNASMATDKQLKVLSQMDNITFRLAKRLGAEKAQKAMRQLIPRWMGHPDAVNEWLVEGSALKGKLDHTIIENAIASKMSPAERQMYSAGRKDMLKVAKGQMSMEEFRKTYAKDEKGKRFGERFEKTVKDTLDEINADSIRLDKEYGALPPDLQGLRDSGAVEKYVANVWRAYSMPEYWNKKTLKASQPEILENARQYLMKENGVNWDTADHIVDQILGGDEGLKKYVGDRKVSGNLRARKVLAPEIQALLGEEVDGPLRIAITRAKQKRLLNKLDFWSALADFRPTDKKTGVVQNYNPYWSPGRRTALGEEVQVPPNPKEFGRAAGGFVPKEFAHLLDSSGANELGENLLSPVAGHMKKMQVLYGGLNTWENNAIRNMKPMILSGGMGSPLDAKFYWDAGKLILDWRDNPAGARANGKLNLVENARKLNVLPYGMGGTEMMGGAQKRWARELRMRLAKETPKSPQKLFQTMKDVTSKFVDPKQELVAAAYDSIDQVAKFGTWLSLRDKYITQMRAEVLKSGKPFPKGSFTLEQVAERKAALRVAENFINFEDVSPLAEKARNNIGTLNPYFTSTMEEMRINATYPSRLRNMEYMGNALKAAMVVTGAMITARELRALNGIPEEEADAALESRSDASQYYRPLTVVAPWHDAKGRVQPYDFSTWFPDAQYFQGNPGDSPMSKLVSNILNAPTQGSFLEPVMKDMQARGGLISPVNHSRQLRPDEIGVQRMLEEMGMTSGVLPGAIPQWYRTVEQGDPDGMGPTQEVRTGSQVLQKLAGVPALPGITVPHVTRDPQTGKVATKSPTYEGQQREIEKAERAYARFKSQVNNDPRYKNHPELRKKALAHAKEELDRRHGREKEVKDILNEAREAAGADTP